MHVTVSVRIHFKCSQHKEHLLYNLRDLHRASECINKRNTFWITEDEDQFQDET